MRHGSCTGKESYQSCCFAAAIICSAGNQNLRTCRISVCDSLLPGKLANNAFVELLKPKTQDKRLSFTKMKRAFGSTYLNTYRSLAQPRQNACHWHTIKNSSQGFENRTLIRSPLTAKLRQYQASGTTDITLGTIARLFLAALH